MKRNDKRGAAHSAKVTARNNIQHIQVYPRRMQMSSGRDLQQSQMLEIVISLQGSHLSTELRSRWWCIFEVLLRQYLSTEWAGGCHE